MTSEINILSRCGLFPLSNSWLGTAVFRGNCFEIPLAIAVCQIPRLTTVSYLLSK